MKTPLSIVTVIALAFAAPAYAKGKMGFDDYDKNNDGVISKSEAFGHPVITKRWAALDRNRDGKISRKEWNEGHAKPVAKGSSQDRRFSNLDRNKDGVLERSEARGHLDRNASTGR